MDWHLFSSTFVLIFLAEIPDKTALAIIMMATRGKPFAIFLGVGFAFFIQTVAAVLFGSVLSYFPEKWIHVGSGFLFLGFAVATWRRVQAEDEKEEGELIRKEKGGLGKFWRAAWSSFLVIFIAEWGDLTQLATASLVARFNSVWTIFFASLLALWAATAVTIVIGVKLKKIIKPDVISKVAAVCFAAVGFYLIIKELS